MAELTSPNTVDSALGRFRDVLVSDFGPERHPDINIRRVTDYLRKRRINPTPTVILSQVQVPTFHELLKRAGLGYTDRKFSNFSAQFFPELGMTAIYRDSDYENINGGPVITEGDLVHEECHADEGLSQKVPFTKWIGTDGGLIFKRRRSGFGVDSHNAKATGYFLEEGYADVNRGDYMASYAPESYWQRLAAILGLPYLSPNRLLTLTNLGGDQVQIAAKYANLERDKEGKIKLSYSTSGLPAAALELLFKYDPELNQMMIDARYDIESYRRLVHRLNTHDRLYSRLSKLSYNHDDFFTGLKLVSDYVKEHKKKSESKADT